MTTQNLHDLTRADRVQLQGPWEFHWNRVLRPGAIESEPDARVMLGRPWMHYQWGDHPPLPVFGVASYRMVLEGLPEKTSGYELYVDHAGSTYHAQITELATGRVLAEGYSGNPYQKPDQLVRRTQTLHFYAEAGQSYELLIVIANQTAHRAGILLAPILGVKGAAVRAAEYQAGINTLALGICFATGVYLFMLWWHHSQDHASVALSLMALISVLRIVTITPWLRSFFPDSWHELLIRWEYMTIPLGPGCYLYFLDSVYGQGRRSRLVRAVYVTAVPLAAWALLAPFHWVEGSLLIYQAQVLYCTSVLLSILIPASLNRMPGISLILTGCVFLISAVLFDIVIVSNTIFIFDWNVAVTPWAVAVFLVMQAQFIARRAADAYDRADRYAKELVVKEEARTLFFHNSSHELRTPLNGIIGFLGLIRQGQYGSIPAAAGTQIDKVLNLAEGLKTQVNTILDLAKSRKGELQLRRQQLSLPALARHANLLCEGLCLKDPARLSFELSLQADDKDSLFIGDEEKIFTILRNLVGNAFKFHALDRPNHVQLRLTCKDRMLRLEVKDTGIGIPTEFQARIFEEFYQVQGHARRAYEGTGLGLSMVKNLSEQMGGTIELHSKAGEGSTFAVTIPSQLECDTVVPDVPQTDVSLLPQPALPQPAGEEPSPLPAGQPSTFKVLIIDDNEINCEVMVAILQADGYQTEYQLSGQEGLIRMKNWKPDLVLLDMMMPVCSGEDVFRLMQVDADLAATPVILITARASDEDRMAGLSLGVDDYLAKPLIAAEVRLRVRNILRRHQLLKQLERNEVQERFQQLGELFHDLSHEMSNIFQGSVAVQKLDREDHHHILNGNGISPEHAAALAAALTQPSSVESLQGATSLVIKRDDPAAALKRRLRHSLLSLGLDGVMIKDLWAHWESCPAEDLQIVEARLRTLLDYATLFTTLNSSRSIMMNVLSFTRATNEIGDCSLDEALAQIVILLSPRLQKYRIAIELPRNTGLRFRISQASLLQILLNLMINASDAISGLDPKERWITFEVKTEGRHQSLICSNGGPGIPPEIASHIFERGFTTKGRKGSGLGLALSSQLASRAGGSLRYEQDSSHPTFVFTLPSGADEVRRAG